jgi:CRP/FNR family transcriptional regulator
MGKAIPKPSVLEVLNSSTLLNSLSRDDFAGLAPVCHLAFAERGQIIWMTGAQVPFFGIVGAGFVKMVHSSRSGADLTAEIMGPGQIFGLLGAIEGGGCPLSARAVTGTWYLKVPKREFLDLYGHATAMKDHVVVRTATRLRQAYAMLAQMATGTVEQRLAAVLAILSESYGAKTDLGVEITVPLTRQDLAELAGTTVETTIRTVSRWQRDGWVTFKQRRLVILDEGPMLAQFADP